MSLAEAPITEVKREPLWSGREAVKRLLELQDQAVDLSGVVGTFQPNHVHYIPEDWLGRNIESRTFENDFEELTEDYLKENELEGTVESIIFFPDLLHDGITVTPKKLWPTDKTLLFPWVDFQVHFTLTEEAEKAVPVVTFPSTIPMNTTRVEGNLYRVDFALGKNQPRTEEALLDATERMPWFYNFEQTLGKERLVDCLVIARDSQRLITACLRTEVD